MLNRPHLHAHALSPFIILGLLDLPFGCCPAAAPDASSWRRGSPAPRPRTLASPSGCLWIESWWWGWLGLARLGKACQSSKHASERCGVGGTRSRWGGSLNFLISSDGGRQSDRDPRPDSADWHSKVHVGPPRSPAAIGRMPPTRAQAERARSLVGCRWRESEKKRSLARRSFDLPRSLLGPAASHLMHQRPTPRNGAPCPSNASRRSNATESNRSRLDSGSFDAWIHHGHDPPTAER